MGEGHGLKYSASYFFAFLSFAAFVGGAYGQTRQHAPVEAQRALIAQGYKLGTPDGNWGKRSVAALKSFQKTHDLAPSGQLDDETLKVLFPEAPEAPPASAIPTSQVSIPSTVVEPATIQAPPADPISSASVPEITAPGRSPTIPIAPMPAPAVIDQKSAFVTSPPATNTDSSSAPAVWVVIALIVGLFFWRLRKRKATRLAASQSPKSNDSSNLTFTISVGSSTGTRTTRTVAPARGVFGSSAVSSTGTPAKWIPAATSVQIGDFTIAGGMIYVGQQLKRQNNPYENENCLIDPSLSVANSADSSSVEMGYWPSYSGISPGARKAYLTWLATARDNPGTNIGFVFLYFYGLERRLLLERKSVDASSVVLEVRRLLTVYGEHHSFRRYAEALLSAYALGVSGSEDDYLPTGGRNGYEVPLSVKVALGRRVENGLPIEPELLLMFVMTHPETSVRTPAKRAYCELKQLFSEKVAAAFPAGVHVSQRRAKKITATYRACSNSFEIDVTPPGEGLPDITGHKEPLAAARKIFDDCMSALDAYSRELGRSEGLVPTMTAVSKLPPTLRRQKAEGLLDRPFVKLNELAERRTLIHVADLCKVVGIDGANINKAKLKDVSSLLGIFGFAHTCDPTFIAKTAKGDEAVRVFALAGAGEEVAPTEEYAHTRMLMMLSLAIALADGAIHNLERRKISDMIAKAPGLSIGERVRLEAELDMEARNPSKLSDWYKRVKDAPTTSHARIADELIAVAVADGSIDSREVAHLEKLFKQMGLNTQLLYAGLQAGYNGSGDFRDDELPIVVPAGDQKGVPIQQAAKRASPLRFDASRLEAIRRDTKTTASVLATIFDEPGDAAIVGVIEEVAVVEPLEGLDGLERRYVNFLVDLHEKNEWSAGDFDQLARNASLLPGAAREALNDWALDCFDELLIEGDDPIDVNKHILPPDFIAASMNAIPSERELA